MAKRVRFGKPKKKPGGDTSFDFGFNVLSKRQKRDFRKKSGGKGGGS
jgi:hypothetical protein